MKLTEAELVLYLQAIRIRHGLTNVAFEEIITFIALLTDSFSGPLGSRYMFDRYVSKFAPGEKMQQYFFCCSCYSYYEESSVPKTCNCGVEIKTGDNHFIYQSLKTSIRSVLQSTDNCCEILNYNSSPPKINLADVTNGKRYQEIEALHRQRHGIQHENVIEFLTVCVNIDGVQVFQSSAKSLYPAMITFNEMDPRIRGHNVIIPLLFTSTKSVKFHQLIMKILVEELREIELSGIEWFLNGVLQKTFIYTITLCLDAPIKSTVLGISGHSAKDACPLANCRGIWMPKGKGGAVSWPDAKCGTPRSCADGDPNSIFSEIPALHDVLYKATSIDSLHGIYIGCTKYLVEIMFFSSKLIEKKVRDQRLKVADEVLRGVKVPYFLERFRLLSECTHWKAHEWRNFLNFFSVPILCNLVSENLLEAAVADHWFNFVLGTSLLNKDEITTDDLSLASEALLLFVQSMDKIFGGECCTYNIHMLLHLSDSVQYLGPLWSTSMFKFEGYNRTVLKSFNGTTSVGKQIATRLSQRRSLKFLHEQVEECFPFSPALDHSLFRRFSSGIKLGHACQILPTHVTVLQQFCSNLDDLSSHSNVAINAQRFNTNEHPASKKKDNCYMYSISSNNFGRIEGLYYSSSRTEVYVVYQTIISDALNRLPHALFNCHFSGRLLCDKAARCKPALLVSYNNGGSSFSVAHMPNSFESS